MALNFCCYVGNNSRWVELSETTFAVIFSMLYPYGYVFKAREEIIVKGKGPMNTYFLIGASYRSITQPDDQFNELEVVCDPDPIQRRARHQMASRSRDPIEKIKFVNVKRLSLKSSFLSLGSRLLHKITSSSSQNVHPSDSVESQSKESTQLHQPCRKSRSDKEQAQSTSVDFKSTEL